MCLQRLTEFEIDKFRDELPVYKVLRKERRTGIKTYISPVMRYCFREGENLIDKGRQLTTNRLETYDAGFHCFLHKSDADNYSSLFGGDVIEFKVKKEDITAIGLESLYRYDEVVICSRLYYHISRGRKILNRIDALIYNIVSHICAQIENVFRWTDDI